jgi:hypothetical protein
MKVKSIDRIISAKDYGGSGKGYLRKQQEEIRRKFGFSVNLHGIDKPIGKPVESEIWQGQWIARCDDCNGASFIDPEEPVFFCFGCVNRANGGFCRPVMIPENWREIETILLERPVDDVAGMTDLERAGMARPILYVEYDRVDEKDGSVIRTTLPLVRSWKYGETAADLLAQHDDALRRWRMVNGRNDGIR